MKDASQSFFVVDGTPTLDEVKQLYLRYVLDQHRGNKSRAARVLGVARRSAHRMLRRLER